MFQYNVFYCNLLLDNFLALDLINGFDLNLINSFQCAHVCPLCKSCIHMNSHNTSSLQQVPIINIIM